MRALGEIQAALVRHAANLVGSEVVAGRGAMQRGIADAIESEVGARLRGALGAAPGWRAAPAGSRRSMEDFSVTAGKTRLLVDIKSRDQDGVFSMPNLASIARLRRLCETPGLGLAYCFVAYRVADPARGGARIEAVEAMALEELDPACLQIQNLGLGQLQLRQGAPPRRRARATRARFLAELAEMATAFHSRQIAKIEKQRADREGLRQRLADPGRGPAES